MAEKSVVLSLKVNTGNSVQDIQAMDAAVNDLNQDLKATQKTAADNTGIDTFDQKLQELNARVEAGGLTMRDLTRTMKEYQNLAAQAGSESPIGAQAIANAANLKDEIGDLKAQTLALSSDFVGLDTSLQAIETGAAAFQGIQSAVALTGVESEALTQTMVKLQAVQGLVNSVSIIANNLNKEAILGIQLRNAIEKVGNFIRTGTVAGLTAQATAQGVVTTATTATTVASKALRAALVATGIGAFIVLLGFAADAMGMFGDETEDAEEKQKELDRQIAQTNSTIESQARVIASVSDIIEDRVQQEINAAKRRGASEQEINKITKEGLQDRLAFLKQEEEAAKNFYFKKIKDLKASNKEMDAAEEAFNKVSKERRDLQRKIDNEDADREYKSIQDRQKRQKDASDKRLKAQQDEAKRLAELARKANEDRIKAEDEQFQLSIDLMAENAQKELLLSTMKYDKMRDQAHGNAVLLAEITTQEMAERLAIVNKYNQMELDKIAEQEAKKKSLRDQVQRFLNTDRDNELLDLEEWYKQQEAINLKAFQSGAIDEETFYDAGLKAQEEYRKKKADIDKKYGDIAKEESGKERDEIIANIQQAIETTQKYFDEIKKINDVINQVDQLRLDRIASNREADLANLDQNLKAQLNQEGLTADQRAEIEQKFAIQKYNIELKAYQEEEKIKKAQFIREKALKIGQIAMDTASGVMKAAAASPLTFGLPWSAFVAGLGIAQAGVVASQQYKSGQAPSPPNLSGGGAGLTGGGSSSFVANTNTQTTDLTQMGQGQQGQTTTTQVVVLESDITNTQNKVQLQEAKSSF
jgi:hypothetical protein